MLQGWAMALHASLLFGFARPMQCFQSYQKHTGFCSMTHEGTVSEHIYWHLGTQPKTALKRNRKTEQP